MSLNLFHGIRSWTQRWICGANAPATTTTEEEEHALEAWSRRASVDPQPHRLAQLDKEHIQ